MNTNTETQAAARSESSKANFEIINETIRNYRRSTSHKDSRIVAILSPVAKGPVQVIFEVPSGSSDRRSFQILPDGTVTGVSYWHETQI